MAKLRKEFLHIITSLTIVISVVLVGILAIFTIISTALSKSSNSNTLYSLVRNSFCIDKIQEPTLSKNDKIIVLRLDDVQAFAWSDISMRMIRDAYDFNAPIVAGIIPNTITEDIKLSNFLKREHCNIEIAIHGWDHYGKSYHTPYEEFDTEFWNIWYESAKQRIGSGILVAKKFTKNKIPTTFIPPYNLMSNRAQDAAHDLWIKIISSIWDGIYDYHTTTYNFDKKRIVPVQTIVKECNKVFLEKNICVVMMHPQDYSNKEKKLDEWLYHNYYIHLLEELQKQNVKFATFEEIEMAKL